MHFTRGEMSFIVFLALIAIFYAIYDVDIRVRDRRIPEERMIEIHIPEQQILDPSFYDISTSASSHTPSSSPTVSSSTPATKDPMVVYDKDGITSKAYVVGNLRTGEIYASKNARLALPIASMSKLMTAYVGTQVLTSTTTITVTEENTKVYPDPSNLRERETFTFDTILYPLLLNSSNVAAEAIATAYGRTDFLELMSSYAWEIGLPSSYFSDPSGLSPHNRASAQGFFELTKYIYDTNRDLFVLTRTPELDVSTTTEHGSHQFTSTHPFVKDPRFLGGKTGRTPEAGDTMLTILDIAGEPVAFIVLGGAYDMRKADTDILISKLGALISFDETLHTKPTAI